MFVPGASAKRPIIEVPIGAQRLKAAQMRTDSRPDFPSSADIPFLQNSRFRVTVAVIDSLGIGVMPTHPPQDRNCNTLANVAAFYAQQYPGKFGLPNFQKLGLGNICPVPGVMHNVEPAGVFGKLTLDPIAMTDTITGHWGLMGLNTGRFPTYPETGIPQEIMGHVEREVSRKLGMEVKFLKDGRDISGTTVIEEKGNACRFPSRPLAYTSSDSVFQIACYVGREIGPGETILENERLVEEIVKRKVIRYAVSKEDVEKMYAVCKAAREVLNEHPDWDYKFLRVIARPFADALNPGEGADKFKRITSLRRDYVFPVPGDTILDFALKSGYGTVAIGKILEIFSGKGLGQAYPDPAERRHLRGDMEGIDFIIRALQEATSGIVFANLVDCDEQYGHRNKAGEYAENLMAIDARLPEIFAAMNPWDIFIITGDHGNDPTRGLGQGWGTNHTREYVPFLMFGDPIRRGFDLGIKEMAEVGATIAHYLGFMKSPHGASFLDQVLAWNAFNFV